MSVTAAALKEEIPALAAVPDSSVNKWLDRASKMVNPDIWGELLDDGVTYLAAHLMVCAGIVTGASAAAGAVKSKSVGPVSVTYATTDGGSASDNDLERTPYGRIFKALRATRPIGPIAL